jgi:hypothetical protein
MAARKPKTEERAKGLIGLKKGKKVAGAAYSVGNYKGKTLNLTKKQLGKKGTAAAKKRTVNISNTKYDATAKKVMGPAGKPLTGKVDLGGGNMAVYRNGVRVSAAKKVVSSGGAGGGGDTGGKTGLTRGQKAESARYTGLANSPNKGARQTGGRRTAAQANKMGAEGPRKNAPKPGSGSSSKSKNWWNTPVKESIKGPFVTGPKRLDKRRGPKGMEIYNGSKWILIK